MFKYIKNKLKSAFNYIKNKITSFFNLFKKPVIVFSEDDKQLIEKINYVRDNYVPKAIIKDNDMLHIIKNIRNIDDNSNKYDLDWLIEDREQNLKKKWLVKALGEDKIKSLEDGYNLKYRILIEILDQDYKNSRNLFKSLFAGGDRIIKIDYFHSREANKLILRIDSLLAPGDCKDITNAVLGDNTSKARIIPPDVNKFVISTFLNKQEAARMSAVNKAAAKVANDNAMQNKIKFKK